MGRKSVAVLDVRSSEVTVLIGERGVNHTFVFKASRTEPYEGYDEDGAFFADKGFADAVLRAVDGVERVCGERIRTLYVGVPGMFTLVVPKEHEISFPASKRISQRDVTLLFDSGREECPGYRFIRATSMFFLTSDKRRVIDPVGLVSDKLSGLLTYFYCSNYFAERMQSVFGHLPVELRYLPSEAVQASYLIPPETRDETALFLDTGYLASTVCVLLGNGVLTQRTFWVGRGQIVARLMEAFSLPYDGAALLLSRVNLSRKDGDPLLEFTYKGTSYEIPVPRLLEEVKAGLDDLCEAVSGFLEECAGEELDYKPLLVTGEGVPDLRGALEHIGKRLNRVCEPVSPDLPFFNKPSASSRIALVDTAYEDHRKRGLLCRILNVFGGKL